VIDCRELPLAVKSEILSMRLKGLEPPTFGSVGIK